MLQPSEPPMHKGRDSQDAGGQHISRERPPYPILPCLAPHPASLTRVVQLLHEQPGGHTPEGSVGGRRRPPAEGGKVAQVGRCGQVHEALDLLGGGPHLALTGPGGEGGGMQGRVREWSEGDREGAGGEGGEQRSWDGDLCMQVGRSQHGAGNYSTLPHGGGEGARQTYW